MKRPDCNDIPLILYEPPESAYGMFGRRLYLARKVAGLSMRALAERMDPKITAQAISKYEAGKMMPSSAVLVSLGKVLNISLDFLMSTQVETLENLEFHTL